MKNKTWALCIFGVLLICGGLSIWLLQGGEAAEAQVWSDGELLYTLDLTVDRQITVESQWGTNVITVSGGKIAVTEADCPDGYCMQRGFCDGEMQIVCLPNRLVIQFVGSQDVDSVVK